MKRLVLFNGGLKSTFLAELAKREGDAVLYYLALTRTDTDEVPRLESLARHLGLPLEIHYPVQSPPLEETLLHMLYLMLTVLPVAKEQSCKCIYHGLSRDDDLRINSVIDQFVKQLNDLVTLAQPLYDGKGIWLGNVEVETPLRCLDRPRVIRLGNEWNIPWELTHSCSRNTRRHCGSCLGCLRRKRAFKREGCADPTIYAKAMKLGLKLWEPEIDIHNQE